MESKDNLFCILIPAAKTSCKDFMYYSLQWQLCVFEIMAHVWNHLQSNCHYQTPYSRAVKKFSSSRLVMNGTVQAALELALRHKFLRAKGSRDIDIQSLRNGISRDFHGRCYVVSSEYSRHWEQCHLNVASIP